MSPYCITPNAIYKKLVPAFFCNGLTDKRKGLKTIVLD